MYSRLLNFQYKFSTNKKIYKPVAPLLQKYNVLFAHPMFAAGKLLTNYTRFFYFLPAGIVALMNSLSTWNLQSTSTFAIILTIGFFLGISRKNFNSTIVQCIQIKPQIKSLYLTCQLSPLTMLFLKQFGIPKQQFSELINSYHPLKIKNPDLKIATDFAELQRLNMKVKDLKQIRKIQSNIARINIPLQFLKFRMVLTQNQKLIFDKDLEELTPKQMINKYGNKNIFISFQAPQKSQMPSHYFELQIFSSQNVEKIHQDYLLALALGYEIDNSPNSTIGTDTQNKVKANAKNQQVKAQSQANKDKKTQK